MPWTIIYLIMLTLFISIHWKCKTLNPTMGCHVSRLQDPLCVATCGGTCMQVSPCAVSSDQPDVESSSHHATLARSVAHINSSLRFLLRSPGRMKSIEILPLSRTFHTWNRYKLYTIYNIHYTTVNICYSFVHKNALFKTE